MLRRRPDGRPRVQSGRNISPALVCTISLTNTATIAVLLKYMKDKYGFYPSPVPHACTLTSTGSFCLEQPEIQHRPNDAPRSHEPLARHQDQENSVWEYLVSSVVRHHMGSNKHVRTVLCEYSGVRPRNRLYAPPRPLFCPLLPEGVFRYFSRLHLHNGNFPATPTAVYYILRLFCEA